MKLRRLTAMISTTNDYSNLKWPLTLHSVCVTVLAFILLLSFNSNTWFEYEINLVRNVSTKTNTTVQYSRPISHGSFGLWELCSSYNDDSTVTCDTYTRQSRPDHFSLILILVSCALFVVNLTFFPSWAATILVLYNTSNRYISYILVFLWIMFILSLTITVLLICAMMFIATASFYAPGNSFFRHRKVTYHTTSGVFLMLSATILAIVCLLLVIISLIWKKFLEVRLNEAEKELYRQLADDNFQPGWHKVIRIPRSSSSYDNNNLSLPPPYQYNSEQTTDLN